MPLIACLMLLQVCRSTLLIKSAALAHLVMQMCRCSGASVCFQHRNQHQVQRPQDACKARTPSRLMYLGVRSTHRGASAAKKRKLTWLWNWLWCCSCCGHDRHRHRCCCHRRPCDSSHASSLLAPCRSRAGSCVAA